MLKETKRTLALVLALLMMFGTFSSSLGTAAYADEPETEEEQVLLEYPEFRQSAFIDWEFEAEAAKRAEQGEDFVKVCYSLGNVQKEFVIPPVTIEEQFRKWCDGMDPKDKDLVQQYYKKYDINNLGKKDVPFNECISSFMASIVLIYSADDISG